MAKGFARVAAWLRIPEVHVALFLLAVTGLFMGNIGLLSPMTPNYTALGGEYYHIAQAIADGRGFSDPFGERSGPTAWMPPLYPVLLAGGLATLHDRHLVAWVVIVFSILSYVLVGVVVFRIARLCSVRLSPYVSVILYVIWLWTFAMWFFLVTHDVWLITLLTSGVVWVLSDYTLRGSFKGRFWSVLGAMSSLTSPAILFAWVGLSGLLWWRHPVLRRALAVAGLVTACCAAPWVIRNAVVFGVFVPTKSNLVYEMHQANYMDDDGIYDSYTFLTHPFISARARFEHGRLGEQNFMRETKRKLVESFKQDPLQYFRKVANRVLAVSVMYVPFFWSEATVEKSLILKAVYPLPFLALLYLIWARGPATKLAFWLAAFVGLYLTPYVLVAFYSRYWVTMVSPLVLVSFIALDRLALAYATRREQYASLS